MSLSLRLASFLGILRRWMPFFSKTHLVNRTALVLIPQEPYIKWAAKVSQEPVAEVRKRLQTEDFTAYLLPQNDGLELDEEVLKEVYLPLFEQLLEEWYLDKAEWPQDRSYATFKQWFNFIYCNAIIDLCPEKLTHRSWSEF